MQKLSNDRGINNPHPNHAPAMSWEDIPEYLRRTSSDSNLRHQMCLAWEKENKAFRKTAEASRDLRPSGSTFGTKSANNPGPQAFAPSLSSSSATVPLGDSDLSLGIELERPLAGDVSKDSSWSEPCTLPYLPTSKSLNDASAQHSSLIALPVNSGQLACDQVEALKGDPHSTIEVLKRTASTPLDRDKWMVAAGQYRRKGNAEAAIAVVSAMVEGEDSYVLQPSFEVGS